jgi:hypothetical protein
VGKPHSQEVYYWPLGGQQPASSALLELGDVDWIQLDILRIDHTEYGSVELTPGTYCVEMGKLFGVSVLVDPRMWVEHTAMGKVQIESGRRYRLAADRTTGPRYTVSFAFMDAVADSVIPRVEKPGDFELMGTLALGDSLRGNLEGNDPRRSDCSLYEAYGLDVQTEVLVEITLESQAFDPYLLLVSPSGELIGSEDAGQGRKKIRIRRLLSESGRWLVIANTLLPKEAGAYRLAVERR